MHEEGFQLEREADGALRVRSPNGEIFPEVPPAPELPDDPAGALRARHEANGLRLDENTTKPSWRGEPLDVGYAIDVLHPRAVGPVAATTVGW